MSVIEEIRQKRQKLAEVLRDEEYEGIRRIVEDLYPDTAHFIYELLQNAEDTGATDATFTLSNSAVMFEHNGRPFDKRDIEGITNIGKGSKAGDDDQIGQFGIGFKAVFAYSETPHIWSPTYCFKITDLVLPGPLDSVPDLNGRTRFNFPFNSPKKSSDEAYREVGSGLAKFAATTLLFLSHLKVIRWQSDGASAELRRVEHSENHVEVVKQVGGRKTGSHFLLFEQPVKTLEKKRAAVAFKLQYQPKVRQFDSNKSLAEQLKIVPATPGRVAVYFPAEKETSGLRFHLHAPFVPELSRASIKETRANAPLFEQLAALAANALHQIRDIGLLTAEFLAVLPNPRDPLSERYQYIRTAVIEEMRTQPLTPTHSKSHAPAADLLQTKASIKSLLSDDDLEFLLNEEPRHWAIAPTQRNSDIDRFLDGLEIGRWGIEDFVMLIDEKARQPMHQWQSPPDKEFIDWLGRKSAAWHQRLYALLYDELKPVGDLSRLKCVQIIRLSHGTYSVGDKCFFPGEGVEDDAIHPRVDVAVFHSGNSKKEQANARKFLEEIGVREVGEAEQLQVFLDQRYCEDAEVPDQKTYFKDLRRFIKLVEDEPENARLFDDYWILESEDGWRKPSQIFLDSPFVDTGLRTIHDALPEVHPARHWALSKRYKNLRIANDKLVNFCKAIGVQAELTVKRQSTSQHPLTSELRKDLQKTWERTETKIDEDWIVPGLSEVLSNPSKPLAKLLWRILNTCERRHFQARYRPNKQYGIRDAPSSLGLLLQKHEWIPQGRKEFVRPADASRKRLPKNFEFDPAWRWLEAIGFAQKDGTKQEEMRKQEAMAKELGFPNWAAVERARCFAAFPPEEQQRILADAERRRANDDEQSDDDGGDGGEADARARSTRNKGRRTKGGASNDGQTSTGLRRGGNRSEAKNSNHQFISYVAVKPDESEPDPDGLNHEARMTLEEKAIVLILSREPNLHRTPKNNPGFDLFEQNNKGQKIRWVEVKAMTGCLTDRPVGVSHTQFKLAQKRGPAYWLYVVEHADDGSNARIIRIQDPAGKAKTFTFDCGWIDVAQLYDARA